MKNLLQVKQLSALAVALFICSVSPFLAQSNAQVKLPPDNPELKMLFVEDQHDRGSEPFVEFDEHGKPKTAQKKWPVQPDDVTEKCDRARSARVRERLRSGGVRTGQDCWFAAMIFHHGDKPEDYLLAHVLALTAAYKGSRNGRWLATASLDRYLLSVSRKQIYGTQFTGKAGEVYKQITTRKCSTIRCAPILASSLLKRSTSNGWRSSQDRVATPIRLFGLA